MTLTLVVSKAFDGAVPLYFCLGKIIVDVDGLWIVLLDVVARDCQRGPRGGVFSQPEIRRLVDRVIRRDRLLGGVLVAIAADLAGTDRLVPMELAVE